MLEHYTIESHISYNRYYHSIVVLIYCTRLLKKEERGFISKWLTKLIEREPHYIKVLSSPSLSKEVIIGGTQY